MNSVHLLVLPSLLYFAGPSVIYCSIVVYSQSYEVNFEEHGYINKHFIAAMKPQVQIKIRYNTAIGDAAII